MRFLKRPPWLLYRVPINAARVAKIAKRTLTNLYNERPGWLAHVHATLDAAVAAAYDWRADLTNEEILARLLERNRAAPQVRS